MVPFIFNKMSFSRYQYWEKYPNRKAHLSGCSTANLPFMGNIAHPTPSVFHAEQANKVVAVLFFI